VAGDPQPARVGDPLAVEDEQVRLGLKLLTGGQDDRRLAEGQQAGDVGERHRRFGSGDLQHGQVWVAQDDHGGLGDLIFHSHVHSGYCAHTCGPPWLRHAGQGVVSCLAQTILDDDLPAQLLLEAHRLGRRNVPGMKSADVHH
jgi:hypothetical protein